MPAYIPGAAATFIAWVDNLATNANTNLARSLTVAARFVLVSF